MRLTGKNALDHVCLKRFEGDRTGSLLRNYFVLS